jgi:hypothetical protein
VAQTVQSPGPASNSVPPAERPLYEPPRLQVMTEREILSAFQITQSMATWWATGMC